MGLREQAEADLAHTLERDGTAITLTDPDGTILELVAQTNDISQVIDPETGQFVSGRSASIALRMSSLLEIGMPKSIPDKDSKPWTVSFCDVLGTPHTFKIASSNPDRTIGMVTCRLEQYDR